VVSSPKIGFYHIGRPEKRQIVVTGTCAHGVDQHDLVIQVSLGQAGDEEIYVLHAAVDEIDLEVAVPAGPHAAVMPHAKVGAFHERDAQQLGQAAALEKGGAELAVGEQYADRRVGLTKGGEHVEARGADVLAGPFQSLG
jgi:hypothetical protein